MNLILLISLGIVISKLIEIKRYRQSLLISSTNLHLISIIEKINGKIWFILYIKYRHTINLNLYPLHLKFRILQLQVPCVRHGAVLGGESPLYAAVGICRRIVLAELDIVGNSQLLFWKQHPAF